MGRTGGQPLVSIGILSMNKTEDILACLESVKKQTYRNFTVIVVDNGSTDGTPDAIARAHPDVHLIRNPRNLGISSGRNQGFRYAHERYSSDYFLQIDNDVILDPEYLSHLVPAMEEDASVGITCGKAFTRYPSTTLASAGFITNLWTGVFRDRGFGEPDRGQYDTRESVDAAPGFNTLVRMEALLALGGWNTDYDPYGWDEVELCLRMRRLGYRIFYVPEARIFHSGTRLNRSPVPRYEKAKIENYFKLIRDFASWPQKVTIFLLLPFRWLSLAAGYVLGGQGRIIATHVGVLYNMVRGRSS